MAEKVTEFLTKERSRLQDELADLGESQDPVTQAARHPRLKRLADLETLIQQDQVQPITPAEFPQWIDRLAELSWTQPEIEDLQRRWDPRH